MIDELVSRFADIVFAFPALITAVLIAAIAGPGLGPTVAAIGIFNVPVFARVARSAALGQWPRGYVLAARMSGKSRFGISLQHILPNIAGVLSVQTAIQLSVAIIAEGRSLLYRSRHPAADTQLGPHAGGRSGRW